MNLRASIRTRLTLATAALVVGTSVVVLGSVYLATVAGLGREAQDAVHRELRSLVDHWHSNGLEGLVQEVTRRAADPDKQGFAYLVAQEEQIRIAGNVREWPKGHPPEGTSSREAIHMRQADVWLLKHVRLESLRLDDHHLLVGRDTSAHDSLIATLGTATLGGIALASFLALGGGLVVSRSLLGRVEAMRDTIAEILRGARTERVIAGTHGDEFDGLATQFNQLLDENDRLMEQVRGTANNIAHDLRTPLQRMHGRLEAALAKPSATPEHRAVLEALSADTHRLLDTFNGLLQIARLEDRELRRSMKRVPVAALLADVVDLYGPLAEDAGLAIHVAVASDLAVTADRQLLGQAVANLIDNAMKYAPGGESIEVEARETGDAVEITVADHGPGIPDADRVRVLEQLVRLDSSRTVAGTGLGLSFVAAVARLHGGKFELRDNSPGLRCVLRLSPEAPTTT